MFEEILEDIAQNNGIHDINPYLKLAAGLGALLICLVSQSFLSPLFIAIVMTCAILVLARVDIRTYAGLFSVPLWFAAMSVACIVLISGGQDVLWRWEQFPWMALSVTGTSLDTGFLILCRVIGGMSSLCFIALTTPMTDLFFVMRNCGIPEVVIDLAMIIYRTIFILMDQVIQIYQAQLMRLGYSSWRESISSFSAMCGAAFIASWDAGDDLIRAMESRCYEGKFAVLGEIRPIEPGPLLVVAAFLSVAIMVAILSGSMMVLQVMHI